MLSIIQQPATSDVLFNNSPFLIRCANAVVNQERFSLTTLLINMRFIYTSPTVPVFTFSFPFLDQSSNITFFLVPDNVNVESGVALRAASSSQTAAEYTMQVIADLRKNAFIKKNYTVHRHPMNNRTIMISARKRGNAFRMEIIPGAVHYTGYYSFTNPSGNHDKALLDKDFHFQCDFISQGKTLTVSQQPAYIVNNDAFATFYPESIFDTDARVNKRVSFTWPSPANFTITPKLNALVSYRTVFKVFYGKEIQASITDHFTKYTLAGGVNTTVKKLLKNNQSVLLFHGTRFLTHRPSGSITHPDEPIRLFFITRTAGQSYMPVHYASVTVYFHDGSTSRFNTSNVSIPNNCLGEIAVGFKELGLHNAFANQKITSYSVSVFNALNQRVAAPIMFRPVINESRKFTSFVFYNSFGVPEFISFSGETKIQESTTGQKIQSEQTGGFYRPDKLKISGTTHGHIMHFNRIGHEGIKKWFSDFSASKTTLVLQDGEFIPVRTSQFVINLIPHQFTPFSFSWEGENTVFSKGPDSAYTEPPDIIIPEDRILILEDGTGAILLENEANIKLENQT